MTSYETLRVEHAPGTTPDEGVRCLVLNRPEVMNAMNTQMFVELRAALHDLAYDEACACSSSPVPASAPSAPVAT